MIEISPQLKAAFEKKLGRKLEAKVMINYQSAYGDDLLVGYNNGSSRVGDFQQLYNGRESVSFKWASLDGSWRLGDHRLAPTTTRSLANNEIGFWGNAFPLGNGQFEDTDIELLGDVMFGEAMGGTGKKAPEIGLVFPPRSVASIRVAFDNKRGEYAPDFDIIYFDESNAELYRQEVRGNTGTRYTKDIAPLELVAKMVIKILSWSARSVIKIAELISNIVETYLGDDLFSLSINEGIGNSRLSSSRCVVKLYNRFRKFDVDNTASVLFNQIRRGIRVYPFIGNGSEWVPLGEFYAEEIAASRRSMDVTITAVDKVALLEVGELSDSTIIQPPADQDFSIASDVEWLTGNLDGLVVDGGISLV